MTTEEFRNYDLIISKLAEKFIASNPLYGNKFKVALVEIIKNNNSFLNYDVKKYHHKKYNDIFRIKIGNYRAIFRVVKKEKVVLLMVIGSRGDIYKKI